MPHTATVALAALTGRATVPDRRAAEPGPALFDWPVVPHPLDCRPLPSRLTFTPHAVTPGLAASTGAVTGECRPPGPVAPPLCCPEAAQLLVWSPWPPALTFTPHTVTVGLAALTGAATTVPLLPGAPGRAVAALCCLAGAQLLDWLAAPATLALTPQTATAPLPALTGAETAPPPPLAAPPAALLCVAGAQVLDWPA